MDESAMPTCGAERWLPVPGYEGLYEVSDLGNVRSTRRKGSRGGVLRPGISGTKRTVMLYAGNVGRTRLVSHLVLEAWVGPRPSGHECCHGPKGALDDSLANLSWGTRQKNQGDDRVRDGTSNRGERQGRAILTAEIVILCRQRYKAGERLRVLVEEFGITTAGMSNAISGKTWHWLPGAVRVDRTRHGLKGTEHHSAKLTPQIVQECRARHANGETTYALAEEFGVKQPSMQKAIAGKTWTHI